MKYCSRGEAHIWTLVIIVLALLTAGVVYYGIIRPIPNLGSSVLGSVPGQDERCLKLSELKDGRGSKFPDIDLDGRDDSCDLCVCADRCNNDNDDRDGDKLPDICDKNPNVALSGKASIREFSEMCQSDNLIEKDGDYRCFPSVTG